MKGLRKRLTAAFISIASGTVILSVTFLVIATVYHYSLYRVETPGMDTETVSLNVHFGQAMIQSTMLAVRCLNAFTAWKNRATANSEGAGSV